LLGKIIIRKRDKSQTQGYVRSPGEKLPTDGPPAKLSRSPGGRGLYPSGTLARTLWTELGRARACPWPLFMAHGLARAPSRATAA
jgi:hypothetical protein